MTLKPLNKLLLKQIQKKFGPIENIPAEYFDLLNAVSDSYAHYEAERHLIERSMELSSAEMIEINKKLMEQTQKLKQSNDELREFAYVVSHDLKEPLRSVASYIQLIDRRIHPVLDSDTITFMQYAIDGVKRMSNQLDAILKYAQLGADHDDFSSTPIQTIVSLALNNLDDLIKRNKAVIITELPPIQLNCISSQMVQLLQNLVSNAIKFKGDRLPLVTIQAYQTPRYIEISIADNGIGVPPEYRVKVFEMFRKVHPDAEFDGTAMGLAICKKIVENHKGKIWFDDAYNDGTKLNIRFPIY